MRPVILYRTIDFEKEELESAQKYFYCTKHITDIKPGDFVIPRYSVLPFYKEIEHDIQAMGGKILNSYRQHRYVADLANYYEDLYEITPRTWFHLDQIPEEGPFILKGETNSKKFQWDRLMFAKDKKTAISVYLDLLDDALIGTQQIYIRKFEPLVTYLKAPRGLPVTKEFRFFILFGKIVTGAFYWASHSEELQEKNLYPDIKEVPKEFLQDVITRVGDSVNGYVVDIAQKEDGDWIVVELNDFQMSGLSDNSPDIFYKSTLAILKEEIKF